MDVGNVVIATCATVLFLHSVHNVVKFFLITCRNDKLTSRNSLVAEKATLPIYDIIVQARPLFSSQRRRIALGNVVWVNVKRNRNNFCVGVGCGFGAVLDRAVAVFNHSDTLEEGKATDIVFGNSARLSVYLMTKNIDGWVYQSHHS